MRNKVVFKLFFSKNVKQNGINLASIKTVKGAYNRIDFSYQRMPILHFRSKNCLSFTLWISNIFKANISATNQDKKFKFTESLWDWKKNCQKQENIWNFLFSNVDTSVNFEKSTNLTKVTIYLLTSCNTEERIAQNIYIHDSNRNYKKKKKKINYNNNNNINQERIGIGYKNYKKQCPGLEFRLIQWIQLFFE